MRTGSLALLLTVIGLSVVYPLQVWAQQGTSTNVVSTDSVAQSISVGYQNFSSSSETNCGYHQSQIDDEVVSSPPAVEGSTLLVGYPSWFETCDSLSSNYGRGGFVSGGDFVAYEVFPITVLAGPNVTFTLGTGHASATPAQIRNGVMNGTLWAGFNPSTVTTDSEGVAHSNMTLTGAVLPFVKNDIANVSLPVIATSVSGAQAVAGLPIEFYDTVDSVNYLQVIRAPGPILFPATIQYSPFYAGAYPFGIVYAPVSDQTGQPISVSLEVAGSWENGSVGPLPSEIRVSIVQPTFLLEPNGVLYIWVHEFNSSLQGGVVGSRSYTFAIQENVGNSSYLVPMHFSVSDPSCCATFPPNASASPLHANILASSSFGEALLITGALSVAALIVVSLRRERFKRKLSAP
jgi:hypothetical protein